MTSQAHEAVEAPVPTTQIPTEKAPRVRVQSGEMRDIPLNKLKASPDNVRRVGHSLADIESRAASIAAKTVLQPLRVKPEVRADGSATGYYLVSIGEGRRQALKLLAKRKQVSKTEPIRCVVDTGEVLDAAEISLDENVSRTDMHPADEFEAFKDLAERKGYGAEEIGARFGKSAQTVRQRLRLGAAAPALLDLYRQEALTLDQLMAFAVNPDQDRQMQVFAQLPPGARQPWAIRRAMTETKVGAGDRRVRLVGLEAYVAAGGTVLRDLFTEDGGGWVEDVVLLDRLVAEKLSAKAVELREAEGWKWATAHLDYPFGHGFSRIWERKTERSAQDIETINALQTELSALTDAWADIDPPPTDVAARREAIEQALDAFGEEFQYDPVEKTRAGVMVILSDYGDLRVERGFVRPEDEPVPEPEAEGAAQDADPAAAAADNADGVLDGDGDDGKDGAEEPAGDPGAPLSARLISDLTAHKTAALRDALAQDPDLALVALTHALVSRVFGMGATPTCLEIHWSSRFITGDGAGIDDSPAGRAIAERHRLWARQTPTQPEDFWDFVVGLDADSRASLLAHCVSLSLNAVRGFERRAQALAHAETLATALDLDMRAYWKPTAARYLDGVTKAQVVGAVAEGVSAQAAARLAGLKKPAMVEAAEPLLVEAGWLPSLLRTAKPNAGDTVEPTDEPPTRAAPTQAEGGVVPSEDDPSPQSNQALDLAEPQRAEADAAKVAERLSAAE